MFIYRLSSYMVRPADIPEYLMHNVSKGHSPTVAPSVATPGPLAFRDNMRSEMETARVLVGLGDSSIELVEWVDTLLAKRN